MPDKTPVAEQPVAAPAQSPSVPPPRDPSPGVRITQQIREALTDLGGLALAAYLVSRGAISGQHALYFAVVLLLPSPVLLRVAKIIAARGGSAGTGVAVALLGASAAWAHWKSYAVGAAGMLGLAACLSGCPMPAPDGCSPGSRRCHEDTPQVCSPGQRWTPADVTCSTVNAVCEIRRGIPACVRGAQ
jgi:hypothetical protein